MKLKKLISALLLAVCLFAAVCMTGCGKSYTVTVIRGWEEDGIKFKVKAGETVTMQMVYEKDSDYFTLRMGGPCDKNLYTDRTHITKFVGGVNENITLYYGVYGIVENGEIVFDYEGEKYYIYRPVGATLAPIDFSRSAYGYGEPTDYVFYSDEERTVPLNLESVDVKWIFAGEIKIYVADAQ